MRVLMSVMAGLAMLSACKAAPQMPDRNIPTSQTPQSKPGEAMSPFDADGTVRSSFPKGVVEQLNAIMRRSKAVIDKFDKVAPGIRTAVANGRGKASNSLETTAANAGIATMEAMHVDAEKARDDLATEGQKLEETHFYYDKVIFSGMAIFAEKVEAELADEVKALKK